MRPRTTIARAWLARSIASLRLWLGRHRIAFLTIVLTLGAASGLAAPAGTDAAQSTITYTSAADSFVSADFPTANYNSVSYLKVQGGSVRNGYAKFVVSNWTGPVGKATLRVWSLTSHDTGFDVRNVSDSTWDEKTITYANAPATASTITGSSGPFAIKQWVTVDVTPLVSGNGTYSFALTTASTTALQVATKENGGSTAPQLVLAPPVVPANTAAPAISGSSVDGQVLVANPGTWTGTQPITYGYQWQDCNQTGGSCVAISGATGSAYTATSSDINSTIRVIVTASNSGGSTTATSAPTPPVQSVPPTSTGAPAISGTPTDGQTLTAAAGSWTGSQPISLAYQWQRCDLNGGSCAAVPGATTSSYALTDNDVNSTVRIKVTGTNVGGSTDAFSAATSIIQPPPNRPLNTTPPAITGQAIDGQTLTSDTGTWTGTAPITYSYQWQDCDQSGTACSDIAGATSRTYTVTTADIGSALRVQVTARNGAGSANAPSSTTNAAQAAAPVNLTPPSVSGNTGIGETITADAGSWSGTAPMTFTYQWESCDPSGGSCAPIAGANDTAYDLTTSDLGTTLRIKVTGLNSAGSTDAISDPTVPIAIPPTNTGLPVISGNLQAGFTLSSSSGTWTGSQPLTYSYQWLRCDDEGECNAIDGATDSSLHLTDDLAGANIEVVVTATNPGGSRSANSAFTAPVLPPIPVAPSSVVQPSVTGKPQELQSLAALPGTWAGTTPISIGYQWRRCDPQGATCSDILGATGSVYTPTSADVGFTIRVLVTASNVAGNQSALTAPTALVVQAPYNQVVGQDSPAGFWRLDETSGKVAADASGNGNPGAYSSGPTLGLPGALLDPADKSIGLNGVDQRVIVTPTNGLLDFGTSNFTVEVWLKTAVNIEEAAISKQTLTGPYWDVTVTDDPGHVGQVRAKIYDGNVTRTVYGPTLRVDDNKWHYVAVEYDRANGITVYVDGLSKFTAGSSPGDVTNSSPLRIGFAANFPYFTGDLDEAAAYPSLLSKARLDAHYRAGVDDTAPTPTLTGPPPDVITGNPLPTFSGVAGTVVGDQSSVTVSVYSGGSATGTPVETMHTTAGGDGSWSVPGASPLPAGTYTVQVTQADLAGNVGTSPPDTFSVSGDPVIAAAGDIACDPANKFFGGVSPSACQDAATARLMAGGGYAAVLPIGDEQYDCGAYDVFMQSYDKTWGQFNSIAHPVPGNHEYHSVGLNNTTDCGGSNASGYFQYFGSSAGPAGTGWYSYDIGAWHIVALNTNCDYIGGCDVGSPEEQWLAGDLAAHPAQCTLAYFHHPRWSTDAAGDDPTISSIWQDLYAAGVDVVLNGHAHSYQRFAPQDPNGTADPSNGIREFVVGTGGDGTSSFSPVTPNLTVRNGNTYGVLNLALHANGYTWSFVPVSGSTFTDSGSGTCH